MRRKSPSPSAEERPPVTKTLRPLQPGTLKFVQRYGSALVCVRYREDRAAGLRYTTVELVVDQAPLRHRRRDHDLVDVRIPWRETTLRARAKALGAVMDPSTGLWTLSRRAARLLNLDEITAAQRPDAEDFRG